MTERSDYREISLYMAQGIERSAQECIRDGFVEKGERMLEWAQRIRDEIPWVDRDGFPITRDLFDEEPRP